MTDKAHSSEKAQPQEDESGGKPSAGVQVQQLAAVLTEGQEAWTAADELRTLMQENSRGLFLALNKLTARAEAGQALLVIDQFEELFTLCRDEAERKQFVDNLLSAVSEVGG